MRGFGRSCRGHGHVVVKRVRHTERQRLALGEPITSFAHKAKERLAQTTTLGEPQRERLSRELTTATRAHEHIRQQSTRLTQGKTLNHCQLVNAYDPTIAPLSKGKSNCPAQCGRKPGLASEPATGLVFATLVPQGNPSDASSVVPLIDKVQSAIERVCTGPKRQILHRTLL